MDSEEAMVCLGENCKNIKSYVEDLIIEVLDKNTLCLLKYNPLMGYKNIKLDLKKNKCQASKDSGGSVSCTINEALTGCY
jgi:hypothetical protein